MGLKNFYYTGDHHSLTKEDVGLGNVVNSLQLQAEQNLADLPDVAAARANLDVPSNAEAGGEASEEAIAIAIVMA